MLNHTFDVDLGDACHQRSQAQVPVWVVTDVAGKIIINGDTERKVKEVLQPAWVVTKGRITVNRFFTSSTAMIVCTVHNTDPDSAYPLLPGGLTRKVGKKIQTTDQPFDKGDEFCIWCGYLDELRPVVDKDLKEGRLIRVFVGAVDTIVMSGNANQSVQVIIQARDRLKYLMDSIGTFNAVDFDVFKGAKEEGKDVQSSDDKSISRVDVIIELARRCIGHLENSLSIVGEAKSFCESVCGTIIKKGYTADYSESVQVENIYPVYGGAAVQNLTSTNNYNGLKPDGKSLGDKEVPFLGGTTKTVNTVIQPDLTFNVISGRRPFLTQGAQNNWFGNNQNITDRVPTEFIKFLSLQEPWPTEFFADARSGEYWYAPRGIDLTGLGDRRRFYRTYFFRRAPKNALQTLITRSTPVPTTTVVTETLPPGVFGPPAPVVSTSPPAAPTEQVPDVIHSCQVALLFREESSNINWRSNIIVTNQSSAGASSQQVVHLRLEPYWLQGRAFPCSYYQVVDQTAGDNIAELIAVALSSARLYGKELKAGSLHLIGDPSLTPGEAIQVVGSPLYNGGFNMKGEGNSAKEEWIWDRDAINQYYEGYNALYVKSLNNVKSYNISKEQAYDGITPGSATTLPPPVNLPTNPTEPIGRGSSPDSLVQPSPLIPPATPAPTSTPANTPAAETKTETKPQSQIAQNIMNQGDNIKVKTATGASQAQIMCPAYFGVDDTNGDKTSESDLKKVNTITFPEDPRTIWRVEAVIHKYNENPGDGYRTELALAAPF